MTLSGFVVTAAVEGLLDEVVVRRLIKESGGIVNAVYGKNGRANVLTKIPAYNHAAERFPWFVLVDLDSDLCAVHLRETSLPTPAALMCFRIAVREIESWLLADSHGFARWAGLPESSLPNDVEALGDPKQALVNLVRKSRYPRLIQDVVPRATSGRTEGAGYNARLTEFVESAWDIGRAAARSESLRRALNGIEDVRQLIQTKGAARI